MRRTKGLLAFLEDSATIFPYDVDTCKKKMLQTPRKQRRQRQRQRQRHRRQRQQQEEDNPVVQMMATTLAEQLSIQKPRVVLLFFCDPEQTYSIQVRNRILQVLCHNNIDETGNEFVRSKEQEESSRNDILCCVVSLAQGGEQPQSSSSLSRDCEYSAPQRDFLSGTGLVVTHVASSLALHNIFLPRVAGYPHVMLVQASNGQAFGGKHEELALEWNTPETVRQRWLEGSSGLDCAQQSLAAILFPTACTIL